MRAVLGVVLVSWGCSMETSLEGKATDGLTGKGLGGVRLVAKGPADAPLRCQAAETTTEADGAFRFASVCPDVKYTVTDGKRVWRLLGGEGVVGGAPIEITAWWVPERDGVYLLSGDGASQPVSAGVEIVTESRGEPPTDVRFPPVIPEDARTAGQGSWLLFTAGLLDKTKFEPLIEVTAWGWAFVGVHSEDGVVVTPRTAKVDTSKRKRVEVDGKQLDHLPVDALPPGRWVLTTEGDARSRMVVVGDAKGVVGMRPTLTADEGAPPKE